MTLQCNTTLIGNSVAVDIKDIIAVCQLGEFAGSEDVSWAVYVGQQPAQPDNVVTIYDGGGTRFNTISECVSEDVTFQMRVRCTDYVEGYAMAQKVAGALNLVKNHEISNGRQFHTTYTVIQQETLPEIEFYDDENRPVFLMSFSGIREIALNS